MRHLFLSHKVEISRFQQHFPSTAESNTVWRSSFMFLAIGNMLFGQVNWPLGKHRIVVGGLTSGLNLSSPGDNLADLAVHLAAG